MLFKACCSANGIPEILIRKKSISIGPARLIHKLFDPKDIEQCDAQGGTKGRKCFKPGSRIPGQDTTKQELFEVLDLFKSGAGAMLDGVVAVNKNNEILWSNKTAQRMLNIIPKNDYNRPIFYIYRNTRG